ncbi:hypothetical protein SAMN05216286_0457 [Kosakonia oryzae]|uniref:Uncharacterized protein n=1 Tax=Kosakonia oryzae TaxID=497725 RepID=A0AA94H016_9ENTR|nr:hypothetical protein SAMN05216286_0457 [Kosakonia oryzae]
MSRTVSVLTKSDKLKGIDVERHEKEVIGREEWGWKQQGWREIARSRSLSRQPAENTLTHQALTV